MQLISPSLPSSLLQLVRRLIHALSSLSGTSSVALTYIASNRNPDLHESTQAISSSEASADATNPPPGRGPSPLIPPPESESQPQRKRKRNSALDDLLANPALYSPLRKPRLPIVLCHGLYGFDVRGPSSFRVSNCIIGALF